MATDFDYELNPPALAKQKDLDTCWACCMSALLRSNGSATQASEDALVKKYATTSTGGIDAGALKTVAKDFNYISNAFTSDVTARSIISSRFIIERLKNNGMMMMAWKVEDPQKPNETFFHAQIVWGVIFQSNQDVDTTRSLIHTMNPWTKKYELYPLFWVLRSGNMPLFTCWPNSG